MDISLPLDYLTGMTLYLDYLKDKSEEGFKDNFNTLCNNEEHSNIIGNVLIHPTAKVHKEAVIGPNVTIGEGCTIQKGARI